MIRWEIELIKNDIQVEYRWVPTNKGVDGNEKADLQVTKVAYKPLRTVITKMQNLLPYLDYVSFAHINQRLTEVKWEAR